MKKLAIILGALLAIVILMIIAKELAYQFESSSKKSKWESELLAELTATDSYPELSDSISQLGVMLGEEEGNWIVIDYRDTHAGMIASKAVARTKGGSLFVSSEHFCGRFSGYASYKQMWRTEQEFATEDEVIGFPQYCEDVGIETLSELAAIESAQDPQAQEQLLIQLGFKPVLK